MLEIAKQSVHLKRKLQHISKLLQFIYIYTEYIKQNTEFNNISF